MQRILDGAESLLCKIPLEFVTTSRIATEAGMSVGAVYRFFGEKQSIFDALAARHLKNVREWLEFKVTLPLQRDREAGAPFNPIQFLENVLDTYIAYLDANPSFRALALGELKSVGAAPRHASPISGLPAVLKSFVVERMRVPATPELELSLRVLTEAGERLICFAYEQPTSEGKELVLQQMKRMLAGYLFVRA
jgi:AcrR family transcriptional regulator